MNRSSEFKQLASFGTAVHCPHAVIIVVPSYYRFDIEIHTDFPGRVIVSMHEIVGSVVRDCWLCHTVAGNFAIFEIKH